MSEIVFRAIVGKRAYSRRMIRYVIIGLCIVLLLILGYAGFSALRMYKHISISKELVARSKRFEQIVPGGKPRILVLGDSTAVGTGSDPGGSTAGRFGEDFPNAEIKNFAVNGMKVHELVESFPSFPSGSFDLVLVQIGANDIMQGTPQEEFNASLSTAFDKANAAGTNVVALHSGNIGLAPLFPWPLSAALQSRTLAYRKDYMRIAAEKGVAYVDLYHEAKDDPFKDVDTFYAADGLHLTEAGYGNWYTEIRYTMEQAGIRL